MRMSQRRNLCCPDPLPLTVYFEHLWGLSCVYSGLFFMKLGFFSDSCWSHGNRWVHHGDNEFSRMRRGFRRRHLGMLPFLPVSLNCLQPWASCWWKVLPSNKAWSSNLGAYFTLLFWVMLDSRILKFIFPKSCISCEPSSVILVFRDLLLEAHSLSKEG